MFRNSARIVARVGAQQIRTFSAQPQQQISSGTASKVGVLAVAVLSAAVLTAAVAEPSHSAGFFSPAPTDYKKVKDDIIKSIEAHDEKREDGTSIAPTLVRLAWHASGTYSIFDKTGGSGAAGMRFKPECAWGANAGLGGAREFMAKIAKKHNISHADAWTLAGAAAIESMGGPEIAWKSGRKDSKTAVPLPDGRLPNANMGCPAATNAHIRDIFGRMGFNDQEIVALSGAHAVGRCHEDASGFWGPWTRAESTFSNQYFVLLLEEKWTPKTMHNGKKWEGPDQFENADGTLMMLPSDMALLQDPKFRAHAEAYAKDEELFFKDFAAAFSKLMELGVQF